MTVWFTFSFIYDLFNDDVSSSDDVTSDSGMIMTHSLIGKNVEGNKHDLIKGVMPAFTCRN